MSKASPYEKLFGTRRRSVGRPSGDTEPLFSSLGREPDPVLATVAKRRAYAVVHEEQRERLQDVYLKELAVLGRRSLEEVAADAGIKLQLKNEDGA